MEVNLSPDQTAASILQMHPEAKIQFDEKAATRLTRQDYFRWVFENKPGWQRESVATIAKFLRAKIRIG